VSGWLVIIHTHFVLLSVVIVTLPAEISARYRPTYTQNSAQKFTFDCHCHAAQALRGFFCLLSSLFILIRVYYISCCHHFNGE